MQHLKRSLFFLIISLSFSFEGILLHLDALGQSDAILDKINPYRQSQFKVGSVSFDLGRNIPIRSSLVDFDFIGTLDTNKITSQFIYDRGDYSFRQTKILVRNLIDENKELLMKAHWRQYPWMYNNLGQVYVLQNYLIDYLSSWRQSSFRITKYSHQEDVNLPIVSQTSTPERVVELGGTGLNYQIADSVYNLNVEYSNKVFNVSRYIHFPIEDFNYNSEEHLFCFDYKHQISENIRIFTHAKYGEYLFENLSTFNNYSFGEYEIGSDLDSFYFTEKNKEIKSKFSISLKKLYQHSEVYPIYYWNITYANSNSASIWEFKSSNNFQIVNEVVGYGLEPHEEFFYVHSLIRKSDYLNIALSAYNVEIVFNDYSEEVIEKGDMYELKLNLEPSYKSPSELDRGNFLQGFNIQGVFNHYEYGPIENRAFLKIGHIYSNPKIFKKCRPYFNTSINYIDFKSDFEVALGGIDIIPNIIQDSPGSSNLKSATADFSVGLLFENFDISYNFLNLGGDYYDIMDQTDLTTDIYQMNYLNIKWRFNDN